MDDPEDVRAMLLWYLGHARKHGLDGDIGTRRVLGTPSEHLNNVIQTVWP